MPSLESRAGGPIRSDARWAGETLVESDLVVEESATLTLEPGARLSFPAGAGGASWQRRGRGGLVALGSDGSRHVKVLGRLRLLGEPGAPVRVEGPGFGGLLLGGRGRLEARHAAFDAGAGFDVSCADLSAAALSDCSFLGGRGAVLCCGFARAALTRCRLSGAADIGLFVCDDASARARGCEWRGNRWALAAEGAARVALRLCRLEENGRGADLNGDAELRSRGGVWRGHETAALALGRCRARFRDDAFLENRVGIEALDLARAAARRCRFARNGRAAFLQQRARLELAGSELDENEVAVHVRQESRLLAAGSRVTRCSLLPVRREDRASATLEGCEFDADPFR